MVYVYLEGLVYAWRIHIYLCTHTHKHTFYFSLSLFCFCARANSLSPILAFPLSFWLSSIQTRFVLFTRSLSTLIFPVLLNTRTHAHAHTLSSCHSVVPLHFLHSFLHTLPRYPLFCCWCCLSSAPLAKLHICFCIYIYIYVHMYIWINLYVYMYIHIHVCMSLPYMHICIYV